MPFAVVFKSHSMYPASIFNCLFNHSLPLFTSFNIVEYHFYTYEQDYCKNLTYSRIQAFLIPRIAIFNDLHITELFVLSVGRSRVCE